MKVTLPSFTSSDEHTVSKTQHGDEDDCKIFGGEYYNINNRDPGNDDNMTYSIQSGSGNKREQSFKVQGAGSCLVANFLGIVGYEQALILPQISTELLSKLSSTDVNDGEESIQQQKELFQMMLGQSFLTDGVGILLPKSYMNKTNLTTTKTDKSVISLTISPLERLDDDVVTTDAESPNDGSKLLTQEEGDVSAQHPSKSSSRKDGCNVDNTSPQEDPEWLKLIAQTVEHRLSKQVEESNQIERSAQARIDLVNQGRRTLHAASRLMNQSSKEDHPAMRLRCFQDIQFSRVSRTRVVFNQRL